MEKKKQNIRKKLELPGKLMASADAIKTGNIDALVIKSKERLKVYTEDTADKTYRILIERMNQGAVTLNKKGIILYCNTYFANMVRLPLHNVTGSPLKNFIEGYLKLPFEDLLKKSWKNPEIEEMSIRSNDDHIIPVLFSLNVLSLETIDVLSVIVTNLATQKKNQEAIKEKSVQIGEMNVELHRVNIELTSQNKNKERQAIMLVALTENLKEQQNQIQKVNDKLFEKTALLQKQEEKVIRINNDLNKLNNELENKVLFRTRELEELNRELTNLSLSKDKFLYVISHDLRNPLAALKMTTLLLGEKTKELLFEDIQPIVKIINKTSDKIVEQLNELLEWVLVQHTKTTIRLKQLVLLKEVDNSLELLKEIATQKNIRLENVVKLKIHVHADSILLRSILQNLVTNAIKYTPTNGLISISAKQVGKMVEVSIVDSGVGMTKDARERLINNYTLISSNGTNNEKGTGLGVMLVKDFVAQHGGYIRIESKINRGTSFIFSLPT